MVLDETRLKFIERITIINVVPKIPKPIVTPPPMSHGAISYIIDDDAVQHGVDLPRQLLLS